MSEPRWLDAAQQRDWRAYVDGSVRLTEIMDRDLKTRHGLSVSEYEILVRLSEAPDRRLRMAELAENASQSRSRLSHTCSRLESKGLVKRDNCPNDKRGVYAHLTDEGFAALDRAARDHVETVRNYFIDIIDPHDLEAIGRAFSLVLKNLSS
ncbi:MarR family transcriptional regulator [Actinomadura pelletieri DSM 43383]|uniref:MarR family transcriptional regulator n=2 Tax=Actinomadura TaxID=1988 RepID=A0A372GN86_9ACTN|nr:MULTISPECIES: MarR family transcriptional regulator [Actinomadura]RFS86854.1 MarR family transcriptional regulator [Actinomadura spongiicola]RKS79437.1 MarR family transcriptional regulator [Actinomadura pelletieri DSM 43383]